MGQYKTLKCGSKINIFCSSMFGISGISTPMRVTLNEDSIIENGIHKISYDKGNNFGYVFPEDKYKAIWVFHRTDGPAFSILINNERLYTFMLSGENVKMEDLPCDDETKFMLALKYVYVGTSSNGYHRYV